MVTHFEVRHLLDRRRFLQGGVYFNLGSRKSGAYYRETLIWSPALIRENTTFWNVAGIGYISFLLKDSKKNRLPNFFYLPFWPFPPSLAFPWYIISLLSLIFGGLIIRFNKWGRGLTVSTNVFDTPKTKAINLCERCGWGKSTVNETGNEYKKCCLENFASLVKNYISGLPYSLLPWRKSALWMKLMGKKTV